MENTFLIYLITRLTAINYVLIVSATLFGIMLVFWVVDIFMSYGDPLFSKGFKSIAIAGTLISVILLIVTPTTGEAFFIMYGGKILNYAESNEQLQELPDKAIESVYNYLEELNEEIKEKHNEK